MFALAIVIGIFGYYIFALGLVHILYTPLIVLGWVLLICFVMGVVAFYYRKNAKSYKKILHESMSSRLCIVLSALFLITSIVYLIGTFIPEYAFDAVWYHLTLPKIYIQNHAITHLGNGILYYSDLPRMTEMLYTAVFANDIAAHLIHFGFGILVAISIFLFAKKFLPATYALLASLIFYSNIVVGWESTTAYIDLARTFFEFLALYGFINFLETKDRTWFIESAVMLGLAISTKLIAVGSLFIFIILILSARNWTFKEKIKASLTYGLLALLMASPWLIFSWLNTGNPVYPLFSAYHVTLSYLYISNIIRELWVIFVRSDDPISPLYIMLIPLVIVLFKRLNQSVKTVVIYSLVAVIVWLLTPRTGGGRFMLPYLPAFSVISSYTIYILKDKYLKTVLVSMVIFLSIITIGYRSFAEMKDSTYLSGKQTRADFLIHHLNFNFGDFYDTDHYLQGRVTNRDKVLTYGIHNLYYADFPFVDSSYIQPGTSFNYILLGKNFNLPDRFKNWQLIYSNLLTHITLYNFQGQTWIY